MGQTVLHKTVGERPTILIVEDDLGVARLEELRLQRAGYSAIIAATSEEAMRQVGERRFDLILLDYRLSATVDGLSLYEQLRSEGCDAPVIMVTGFSNEQTVIQALRAGVRDFVAKSTEYLDYLPEAVERVLRQTCIEQQLVQSESRLATIVAKAKDGIILLDGERRITSFNPAAEEMFQCAAASAIGQGIDRLIPSLSSSAPAGHRRLEHDFPVDGLVTRTNGVRQNGEELSIELSISRSSEEKDRESYVIVARDVTESERANELFLRVLESAPDAMVVADADGRIAVVNSQIESLFGHQREQLIGQSVEMLLPDRFRGTHNLHRAAYFANPARRPMNRNADLYGVRRDGTEFPVEISLSPLRTNQGLLVTAAIRDVTERKRIEETLHATEERLQHKQKLEAVGSLAAGVAHEYNNLLQIILGYTTNAMTDLSSSEPRYQYLEQVVAAAKRAAALTTQLLGFGRRQTRQPMHVEPARAIEDFVKMVRPLIGETIELKTVLCSDEGMIHVDLGQFQQILLNLCVNARDAMPGGGRLTIKTEWANLAEDYCASHPGSVPGCNLLLTVADTGCGMPPQVIARIFEPFFTTKEVGAGTGLGLATVYALVSESNGSIDFSSELGVGTSFRVYFPAVDRGAAKTPDESPAHLVFGGTETILVAEDDRTIRDLTVQVLQRTGYKTVVAQDGEEALRVFMEQAGAISLALVDMVMPNLSGRALVQRLREVQPGLPVVFCSGYDPETDPSELAAFQNLPFIQKPYDANQLLRTVRQALDLHAGVLEPVSSF